ncbi:hypothetical protein PanWU01x14_349540 [Parasponia andersonii]|uniref:DUF676 domain-containing protein n=1 Tax=Parasponia andersonii TaxID=3476 RepID=A0A2P5AB96_PARAD|nr:hypothetical protein PanWU01x14_349540 [Parasponia andersonii]
MIAANSPLGFAAPGPARNPNPTRRLHRHSNSGCGFFFFNLSPRSLELNLPVGWSHKKMGLFQRVRGAGAWLRIRHDDDLTVEADPAGGEDVHNAMVEPNHLVIMVNGINGSSADWRYAAEQFAKMLPDKVLVHCECSSPSG